MRQGGDDTVERVRRARGCVRRVLVASLTATFAAVAGAAGAPTGGAPVGLAEPAPQFVAPGGELVLHVRTTRAGVLRVTRRTARGPVRVAAMRVAAGRALTVRHRVRSGNPVVMDLSLDGGPPRVVVVPVRPVNMVAVGDISPGSAISMLRSRGAAWQWEALGPWLRQQDLAVGNLETAIGTGGRRWPGKAFNFIAPPDAVRAAARIGGIDAVSLANNHALDYGRSTFLGGIRALDGAGVGHFGGGADLDQALEPLIVERGGLRIAFVGFNDIPPADFWAGAGRAGNAPANPEAVRTAIRRASARADVVVAYFHWGIEYERTPNGRQRALASTAFASGADIVLGGHPHVLQPVERRGTRLTAWSLGNFLFSPGKPPGTYSGALTMQVDATGVRGWRMHPVRIIDTRPVLVGGAPGTPPAAAPRRTGTDGFGRPGRDVLPLRDAPDGVG